MYIKRLSAINMGPINVVSITFPFDESENPKPVIIVGENGTGKTTLLSNVVDSLYELAEKAFNDVTKSDSGSGHQYFKASLSLLRTHLYFFSDWKKYTGPMDLKYMKCPMVIVFPPRRFRSFRKHMPFILQRRSIKQKSKMQSIRIQQNHLS